MVVSTCCVFLKIGRGAVPLASPGVARPALTRLRRRAHSLAATVRGSHCSSMTPASRLHAFNARCTCPGGGVKCEDLGWLAVSLHPCTPFSRSMSAACLRHLRVYGQVTAQGRLVFGGRGAPHHLWSRLSDRDALVDNLASGTASPADGLSSTAKTPSSPTSGGARPINRSIRAAMWCKSPPATSSSCRQDGMAVGMSWSLYEKVYAIY